MTSRLFIGYLALVPTLLGVSNVANQRVTKQPPPQQGCTVPPAATAFSPSDGKVHLYFEAVTILSDNLALEWITPNGPVYATGSWVQQAGNFCFDANLDISPLVGPLLGSWHVRVLNNATELFSLLFTVTTTTASPSPTGNIISTVIGNGNGIQNGDDGTPASTATVPSPLDIAFDRAGRLYIVEGDDFGIAGSKHVRRVNANGIIETVFEIPASIFKSVSSVSGVTADMSDNLFVAEAGGENVVYKVTPSGARSVVAGSQLLSSGNTPATKTALSFGLAPPTALRVDAAGNLYITDTGHHRVLRVSPAGEVATVAGIGSGGFSGDGGPASSARLNLPKGLALDTSGNLYIADTGNNRIRKVTPTGNITTIAGIGGTEAFGGDGAAATLARLNSPIGLALDSGGSLYVADSGNTRIRRIDPDGTIRTVAGTGDLSGCFDNPFDGACFSGDGGPAASARLGRNPYGVAIAPDGNLYIADRGNNRIRKVTFSTSPPPPPSSKSALTLLPTAFSFSFQPGVTGPIQPQNLTVMSAPLGIAFGAAAITDSGGNWLSVTPLSGTTPGSITVTVTQGLAAGTYGGHIEISSTEASNSPQDVPVTYTVTGPSVPPPCGLSSVMTDSSLSNGVIEVSASGSCLMTIRVVNKKHFWTNLSVIPAGNSTVTPFGGSSNLYAKYGILPPAGIIPLPGTQSDVIYQVTFTNAGDNVTILTTPTIDGGNNAMFANMVQALLNVLPMGSDAVLVIDDYPKILAAMDQMPHLKSTAASLFDSQGPNILMFINELGNFVNSPDELQHFNDLVLNLTLDIGGNAVLSGDLFSAINEALGDAATLAAAVVTIVEQVWEIGFRNPAGSIVITAQ